MSIKNLSYVLHLYNLFEPYIEKGLNILEIENKNKYGLGNKYSTVRLKTISMSQLAYYYNIFYKMNLETKKFEKRIPNEIETDFDAISLALLIMGDGNYLKSRKLIRIYTNCFFKEDVEFLSEVIKEKLLVNNRVIHDRNDQYIILIENNCINLVRDITKDYIHPSMLYKLGIEVNKEEFEFLKFDYFKIIDKI